MPPSAPPKAPNRHRFPLVAGLGVAVLVSSVVTAVVALRSHASSPGNAAAPNDPATSLAPKAAVAIGYGDTEQGVTPLSPLQAGRVVRIDAKEGVAVTADAPLLYLDDTLAKLQEEEARVAVEAAKVRLDDARTLASQQDQRIAAQQQVVEAANEDVEIARIQRDKVKSRYEHKTGGSREDVDAAELLVKKAEAGLQAERAKLTGLKLQNPARAVTLAEKDVAAKEVEVRKAQQAIKECVLRAPCAGTPLRVLASLGEPLTTSPRQPALFFCPTGPRIIRAEVEQEFASHVTLNQTARIQDDATAGGSWTGKVQRISDWYTQRRSILLEPLQFNDVRTLECIITLDPNQPPLRIGQRVRVFLE
jgi:multidrug resistance efflux pump